MVFDLIELNEELKKSIILCQERKKLVKISQSHNNAELSQKYKKKKNEYKDDHSFLFLSVLNNVLCVLPCVSCQKLAQNTESICFSEAKSIFVICISTRGIFCGFHTFTV